ncbi:hypothetical protein DIRU0_E25598 [Diutina rugosa]
MSLLKYRPQVPGSYMDFGILPFLQGRIDHYLKPEANTHASASAHARQVLSVLGSGLSVFDRQLHGTPRLPLVAYLLTLSLTKVPRYQHLKETGVDSLMMVTPTAVPHYQQLAELMLEGLPHDAAPGQLRRQKDGSYAVERVPMSVRFVDAHGRHQVFGTSSQTSQLVISSDPTYQPQEVSSLRFIGIDDFDIVTKSPQYVTRSGSKGKYSNVVTTTVRQLQHQHLADFTRQTASLGEGQRQVLYKPLQFGIFGRPSPPYAFTNGDHQLSVAERMIRLPESVRKRQLPLIQVGEFVAPKCRLTTNVTDLEYIAVEPSTAAKAKQSLAYVAANTTKPQWGKVKKAVKKLTAHGITPDVVVADNYVSSTPPSITAVSVSEYLAADSSDKPVVVVDEASLYTAIGTSPTMIPGIVDPVGDLWLAYASKSSRVHVVATSEVYTQVVASLASQYHASGLSWQ